MKVFLVAGGTGGHIFPAVAFEQWLNKEKLVSSVNYVCGNRALELEIYRHSGIEPLVLPMEGSPFGISGFIKKAKRAYNIVKSLIHMYGFIRKHKPDACFLFGGYVSFPALLVCSITKIPVIMHEQNAVAGKTVRFAKKIGKSVVHSWDNETTSNVPVRPFVLWDRQIAFEKFGIDSRWLNSGIIGIFGGSITSKSLINVQNAIVRYFPDNLFLVLSEKEEIKADNVLFIGRQWDMNPVFSVVDSVICRGGASTLAELEAYNISSIVVPWEQSSDNHQIANAIKFSEITDNYVWREYQDVKQLIDLISLCISKQNVHKTGFHEKASLNLFRCFESKYGVRRKICEQ
ncbi:MAG: UDP-N-acetylglucosamine--N-acetylmuramyl-(pentapeptide) pyrophosphoryl-undecaprenol N-acetylglucosamine transferase [Synergistaceae bacterium]|nr:UDP-N-acetylglucosamine--N-acetylmuramyl-(pentapeptide) pyrophosphoryl-undecaprenol N-acetylglucosamine transferase [Synergistaceae bacterium]